MAKLTIAELHCFQCGKNFPLNMYKPISSITCPYCNTDMDETMIEKVRNAWGYVADLNQDFHKYFMERDEPRFSLNVSMQDVHLPLDDIDSETE